MSNARIPTTLAGAGWLTAPVLQGVLGALQRCGGTARVAGGAVRNALLGVAVKDVDIATDLTPDDVFDCCRKAGLKAVPTGVEHGTVTIVAGSGTDASAFEVTTLRIDVETHGRHADVAFTDDWEADASRRDFTLNALYCDASGTLFDPLNGYADLAARRVRFVGDADQRIREDYLRILRFFRIHAQYGAGALDADGLAACARNADGMSRLSSERIRQEFMRLLAAPLVLDVLGEMDAAGVLSEVVPVPGNVSRVARMSELEAASGREPDALLRLAALALRGERDVNHLRRRFVLTNRETGRLERLAATRRPAVAGAGAGQLKRLLYDEGEESYTDIVLFEASGAPGGAENLSAALALPREWPVPVFALKGRDVIAKGVPAGAEVGAILKALKQEWEASGFAMREEVLRARLDELARRGD